MTNDFNKTENDSQKSRNEIQFELYVGDNYGVQRNNVVLINSIISLGDAENVVGLLNNLYNRDHELKQENQDLKSQLKWYEWIINKKDYEEVTKNNEQLKLQLEIIKREFNERGILTQKEFQELIK